MKNLLLCLIITGIFLVDVRADEKIPAGGRSAALGLCSVALTDFWSCVNNQAALAAYNYISAGFYLDNRFNQKELTLKTIAIVFPANFGGLGFSHTYWGFTGFDQQKTGLACGLKLNQYFQAGLQLDYISQHIAEQNNNRGFATCEIGILGKINSKLTAAAHIFNPVQQKFRDIPGETAILSYRFGFLYQISDKVSGSFETEKDVKYDPAFRGGLEIKVHEKAMVRAGFTTVPPASGPGFSPTSSMLTFGFGTVFSKIHIDFASSYHTLLGSSFRFSIHFDLKGKLT